MSEAPERIYAGPSVDDKGVFWDVGHWDKEPDEGCIEYVRAGMLHEIFARYSKAEADHINELEARLKKAIEIADELAYAHGKWIADIDYEEFDSWREDLN